MSTYGIQSRCTNLHFDSAESDNIVTTVSRFAATCFSIFSQLADGGFGPQLRNPVIDSDPAHFTSAHFIQSQRYYTDIDDAKPQTYSACKLRVSQTCNRTERTAAHYIRPCNFSKLSRRCHNYFSSTYALRVLGMRALTSNIVPPSVTKNRESNSTG